MLTTWFAPLVSTLAGSGVGALALWLIFRADRAARRQERARAHAERFERALADLMRAMHTYASARDLHDRQRASYGILEVSRGPSLAAPADADIWGSYQIALMIARDDEMRVLQAVGSYIAVTLSSSSTVAGNLSAAVGMIAIWRRGDVTTQKAIDDLSAMLETAVNEAVTGEGV